MDCLFPFLPTGAYALTGRRPVNPVCPVAPADGTGVKNKPLAEKTIEDVLLHFGDTKTVARRRYREFVQKGIAQGTRSDLQGGGLVRSAGGDKRGLLGRGKEEREKGDERIFGSGDFVEGILRNSDNAYERRKANRVSLEELIRKVASDVGLRMDEVRSARRNRKISYGEPL